MGFLLFSQKYNQKKIYKDFFMSGNTVKETTPIISFCHSLTKDKDRYDLSIIITTGKYSTTVSSLHKLHDSFEGMIPME